MNRKKITRDISKLIGRVLVFGGVYGNLQALEELRSISESLSIPPSNIIFSGDAVAYCAQPEECVQLLIEWGIHCIAGNVEIQLREGSDDCGCNFVAESRCSILSNQWYPFCQGKLSDKSIQWMHSLPDFIRFEYANRKAVVLHGSYHNTSEFVFRSSTWNSLVSSFEDSKSDVVLAGHCGLPFFKSKDQKVWINSGVIGMPANDGSSKVWYVTINDRDDIFTFRHHAFEYNYCKAAALMLDNQLPVSYAITLSTGIWDNCDVLPEIETNDQGKQILF